MPQDRMKLPPLKPYKKPKKELGGRPRTKFTPEEYKQVTKLASLGITEEQLIESMGYSRHILQDRKKTDVKFREALIKGKAMGIAGVANAQMAAALAGSTQAQQFYLRCKDPISWSPELAALRAIEQEKSIGGGTDFIEFRMTVVEGLSPPVRGLTIEHDDSSGA